jgi:hypothetical protein
MASDVKPEAAASAAAADSAASASPARRGRSVWRPGQQTGSWYRARWFKRGLALALFLVAVGALMLLVFPPIHHPTAQVVFLTGLDYHPLRAPPADYAQEDSDAFEQLAPVLYKHGPEPGPVLLSNMRSAAAMHGLSAELADATPTGAGVLVVYVDAHEVSDGGTAYLLCRNFDPANPTAGRYRLSELLRQVGESPAAIKLLILDLGRIESDPRMGMLVNEFPRLLEQQVHATGDDSLWVLSSNAILERSHVSRALERSVFGYFVTLSLSGAADANGDRAVDLDELYRFVRTNVSAWVRSATGGRETQTPVLLWGGGANPPLAKSPMLVPAIEAGGGGIKLPKASAKFPDVAGGIATPYTNRATQDFVPIATKSQKQVPGMRQARKAAKTQRKVSRKIDESKDRSATEAKKSEAAPKEAAAPKEEAASKEATSKEAAADGAVSTTTTQSGGEAAAANAAEKGAAADAKGDGGAAKPQANATATSSTTTAAPTPPSAGEALATAWQLRDDLDASSDIEPRPLDYAPLTWREYQHWILAEEQLYRAGAMTDPKEIAVGVTKLNSRLASLPDPPPLDKDQSPDLAARISRFRPIPPAGVDTGWSLAMAQFLAQQYRTPMPADALAAAKALDRFATDGTPVEFAAWIKKLDPSLDRYVEVRWARMLSRLQRLNWPLVQIAIATRRLAEQTPMIAPAALAWIQPRLKTTETLRLDAERLLTDGIATDRQATAARLFRQAADLYHEAADDIAVVTSAMQIRNDLLNRAPFYAAWLEAAGWEPPSETPRNADLVELFGRLGELDRALSTPDPAKLEEVNKLAGESAALADRVEAGLAESNVAALSGPTAGAGSGRRMELLLSTPLVTAELRERLLAAVADADAKVAAGFRPLKPQSNFEPLPAVTPERWRQIADRAAVEAALARLAAGQDNESSGLDASVATALADLKAAIGRLEGAGGQSGDELLWDSSRRFGAALADFYRGLPAKAESIAHENSDLIYTAQRSTRLAALHSADRMLRLADIRDAVQGVEASPAGALAAASLYDLLEWQRERLEVALDDASPSEVGFLSDAASSYANQASRIVLQPAVSQRVALPVSITGPTSIDLATEPERQVELMLHSAGAKPTDVWIVCRFAPELLVVKATGDARVYDEQRGRSAAERIEFPPTFRLRADRAEPLRLIVRSKAGARQGTRLIVKAITADAVTMRHEIDVVLPAPQAIELAVSGPPGSWTQSNSQISLYPFPNRKTDFRLSLINNGPNDRAVDIGFLALDRKATVVPPAAALAPEDAEALLKRFGPTRLVATLPKIAVPTGGKAVPLPFPVPAEKKPGEAAARESQPPEPQPPAGSTSGSPSASPAAAAPPTTSPRAAGATGGATMAKPVSEEPPPPPRPALDRGLLAVVTDRETGMKTIFRIDIEPQRPRRYVRPQVGYSLDHETLQIRVTPQDRSLLPASGGVRVHAEIGVPLPAGTQAQLDGELKAPDFVANLFCELPADAAKTVPVRITVDGYPRAFVYHVPLGIQSSDLAEDTDLREIRITFPEPEAAFKAPVESILVDAQVDAPLGAFQNPDDLLEIGIDVDRDRDLRGSEPRVQLTADRQVNIWLDRAGPGGLFSLETNIRDFHLVVPTPPLQNARVSVLGRIFAAGRTGWSEPVDILLDGTPPRLERVELRPPAVVIGPDVEVSVWATDDNLSGVAKVEVGFDTSGHGKFDDTVEPFELERDPTGRWFSKLPTKTLEPGMFSLLVRLTDRAGNVSDYEKVKCHVITKAEADAAKAAPLAKLTGTVVFGNDPAAGVDMTLSSDKGPKIPPAKTDSSGYFSFTNLPPGKYKLTAKSVIHNKTRKTEQDVTVEPPGDEQPKPMQIVLK